MDEQNAVVPSLAHATCFPQRLITYRWMASEDVVVRGEGSARNTRRVAERDAFVGAY